MTCYYALVFFVPMNAREDPLMHKLDRRALTVVVPRLVFLYLCMMPPGNDDPCPDAERRFSRGIALMRQCLWQATLRTQDSYAEATHVRLSGLQRIANELVAAKGLFIRQFYRKCLRYQKLEGIRQIRRFSYISNLGPDVTLQIMQYVPDEMGHLIRSDMKRLCRDRLFECRWIRAKKMWRGFLRSVTVELTGPLERGFFRQRVTKTSRTHASAGANFRICL